MRRLGIACALGLLVGCSAPHAVRVRCDAHLVPINSSAAQSQGPLASADPARRQGGPFGSGGDSAAGLVP